VAWKNLLTVGINERLVLTRRSRAQFTTAYVKWITKGWGFDAPGMAAT